MHFYDQLVARNYKFSYYGLTWNEWQPGLDERGMSYTQQQIRYVYTQRLNS